MSTTTIDPRDVADLNPTAGPTGKLTEADSHFIAGTNDRSYAEDRRMRLRRGRIVRYSICISFWVLGVIPLAREISSGRESAAVVLAYLAVGAISLGIAVAIRGIYVLLTKRKQFWAPSMFLIAGILALMGYLGQTAGYEQTPVAAAAAQASEAGGGSGA